MKYIFSVLALLMTSQAMAGDRMFETREEGAQRYQSERYDAYKSNNYQTPLGGYNERLGDTNSIQIQTPNSTGSGSAGSSASDDDWRAKARR